MALSKAAVPFPQWSELVEAFREVSSTIAAALAGSEAYVNGSFLLIKAESNLAFDMLRNPEKRRAVRNLLVEHTGKQYRLGPYRVEEQAQQDADPLQQLKEKLRESGVEVTEE